MNVDPNGGVPSDLRGTGSGCILYQVVLLDLVNAGASRPMAVIPATHSIARSKLGALENRVAQGGL